MSALVLSLSKDVLIRALRDCKTQEELDDVGQASVLFRRAGDHKP
jgi:hypothetical protein